MMKSQLIPFKQLMITSILETEVHWRPETAEGNASAFIFPRTDCISYAETSDL